MITRDRTHEEIAKYRGEEHASERGDCAVRALMHVGNMPYGAAWSELTRVTGTRKPRGGTDIYKYLRLKNHSVANYNVVARYSIFGNGLVSRGITVARLMRMPQYKKGRFLVVTRGHGFAIVDGVAYNPSGARARVMTVWEFVPR